MKTNQIVIGIYVKNLGNSFYGFVTRIIGKKCFIKFSYPGGWFIGIETLDRGGNFSNKFMRIVDNGTRT